MYPQTDTVEQVQKYRRKKRRNLRRLVKPLPSCQIPRRRPAMTVGRIWKRMD